MTPNYPAWKFWLDAVHLLGLLALGFYTWWTNREKVTNARFRKLEDRMSKVESDKGVCSSHARMEATDNKVEAQLDTIGKGVSRIEGRLEGINRMVDLLTQNELGGGKG